jgi:hypothetical protein
LVVLPDESESFRREFFADQLIDGRDAVKSEDVAEISGSEFLFSGYDSTTPN